MLVCLVGSIRRNEAVGILIFIFMILLGYSIQHYAYRQDLLCENLIEGLHEKEYLIKTSQKTKTGQRLTVRELHSNCPVCILNKSKNLLIPGDTLISGNELNNVTKLHTNPYDFDFGSWLKKAGISHTSKMESTEYEIKKDAGIGLVEISVKLNNLLLQLLRSTLPNEDYLGIVSGICLGEKSLMSESQKSVFEKTGTMHVMAVSGLHVGLIAGIVIWIFPILGTRRKKIVRWVIVVLIMWSFVLITGCKTSAIRAGIMLSIFLSAKVFSRHPNSINALLLAATLMLLFNPRLLVDIGFQFSFAAVLSILIFYPLLIDIYTPKSKGGSFIWQMLVLTLSVQILLAPISVYYFHQFPPMFLLSNLIAIPMAGLTLCGSMLVMGLGLITPDLAKGIAFILQGVIDLGFDALNFLSQFEFTSLSDLWPSLSLLFTYFLFLSSLFVGILFHSTQFFKSGLALMVIASLVYLYNTHETLNQSEVVIYGFPCSGLIDIKSGRQLYSIAKDSVQLESQTSWRSRYSLRRYDTAHIWTNTAVQFVFGGKRFLVASHKTNTEGPTFDYIILPQANPFEEDICDLPIDKKSRLITTGFLSKKNKHFLNTFSVANQIHWHDVFRDGPLTINISE